MRSPARPVLTTPVAARPQAASPSARPRRIRRRATVATAVLAVAGLAGAAPAGAVPSPVPGVDAIALDPPLSHAINTFDEVRAGEGRIAWLTWSTKGLTFYTVRNGAIRTLGKVSGLRSRAAQVESVGTDAAGHPVAILRRALRGAPNDRRGLLRLDTGRVTALRLPTPAGIRLLGVGVDHGKVRFARSTVRDDGRTRTTLLSGRLEGSAVVRRRELHRFPVGFRPDLLVAQQGRVALKDGSEDGRVWAGSPGGGWRLLTRGGKDHVIEPLGFTHDGSAMVVKTSQVEEFEGEYSAEGGLTVTVQPLAGGPARTADLAPLDLAASSVHAWDETTDRIVLRTSFSTSRSVLGYGGPFPLH